MWVNAILIKPKIEQKQKNRNYEWGDKLKKIAN